MAEPMIIRPSQGMLRGFDFLLKSDKFTSREFTEETCLKPGTARSYLRAFCRAEILEETPQYPFNIYQLKDGWESKPETYRLQNRYYYK